MSQRCGRVTRAASTRSVEIAMDGTSERKLLSRICFATSGRNGSSGAAIAMLTMFPKFALVVIEMYLSVFANVRRPSTTPVRSTSRSRFKRMMSALSRAVHRLVDRDTDVGRVQRGGVVDAVPEVADRVAGALERAHDALFLLRINLGEERRLGRRMPERLVVE